MGTVHLAKGSLLPPKDPNKLRLYSMKFCPFVQRARLVLLAKNLDHDIVNVHLQNKPDWIWSLHPEGKVPVLDTGSKIIPESLNICDYLEETYPNPPLYPKDETLKLKDQAIIRNFGDLHIKVFYSFLFNRQGLSTGELIQKAVPVLEFYENELLKRGSDFFNGSEPGMVDYMIWPWVERIPIIPNAIELYEALRFERFERLRKWFGLMMEHSVVKKTILPAERHRAFGFQLMAGNNIDYDNI
nr:pyrimidodiazepine synthase-like isoform X1 [Onthophagus taurus]